jgi:hypothetical protein
VALSFWCDIQTATGSKKRIATGEAIGVAYFSGTDILLSFNGNAKKSVEKPVGDTRLKQTCISQKVDNPVDACRYMQRVSHRARMIAHQNNRPFDVQSLAIKNNSILIKNPKTGQYKNFEEMVYAVEKRLHK